MVIDSKNKQIVAKRNINWSFKGFRKAFQGCKLTFIYPLLDCVKMMFSIDLVNFLIQLQIHLIIQLVIYTYVAVLNVIES